MLSCSITDPYVEWTEVVECSVAKLKGRSLQTTLCKLCFASSVYHLWRQRNDLCHGNTPRTEECIEAQIKCEVRARILFK
jgi:superfamily II helicase